MAQDHRTATLTKEEVADIYRQRAKRYDFTANLYRLIGFKVPAYRRRAIEALHLTRGDTVVDIGCGTGLNFPLLERVVGEEGRIVGVDLTDAMLARARRRIADEGWSNVSLVQSDAAGYQFPDGVRGIISTFAISMVPEVDEVVRKGSVALMPGTRWVILDFKAPTNRIARFLLPLGVLLTRPFGGRIEMAERRPWDSFARYLVNSTLTDLYGGLAFIAEGERGATGGTAT